MRMSPFAVLLAVSVGLTGCAALETSAPESPHTTTPSTSALSGADQTIVDAVTGAEYGHDSITAAVQSTDVSLYRLQVSPDRTPGDLAADFIEVGARLQDGHCVIVKRYPDGAVTADSKHPIGNTCLPGVPEV